MKARSLLAPLSDPDYEALMSDHPTTVREPSVVHLTRCPICREYLTQRSKEAGACENCHLVPNAERHR